MMIRMVGGWMFLLVPAHPGSPRQRAVKRLLLLLLLFIALASLLWHYWLGGRKSIRPIKHWLSDELVAWRSGNVVGRINEVTLRRPRLVLGWVTVFGGQTTTVFHQATQSNSASYPQWDGKWVPTKVRLESNGRYGSFHLWINVWVAGKTVWSLVNTCHTWAL